MKKAIVLAMILCVSLVGCANVTITISNTPTTTTAAPTTATTTAAVPTTTTTTTTTTAKAPKVTKATKTTKKTTTTTSPSPTDGQIKALEKAKYYSEKHPFSYEELVDLLEQKHFTREEAVYAADNCGADWYEQALRCAKSLTKLKETEGDLEPVGYSYNGVINELMESYFTREQAVYAADNCGADWYEQAVIRAEYYVEYDTDGMVAHATDMLEGEEEGFTHEQAVYGAETAFIARFGYLPEY